MIIGAENNPHKDIIDEVSWIVRHFDFLDLTLESPKAHPDDLNVSQLKKIIGDLPVVGHTGWYLPIGAPIKPLRDFAVMEFEKCLDAFEKLDVKLVNVHFEQGDGEKDTIENNIKTLRNLVSLAQGYNIKVMAENTSGIFSDPSVLKHVFDKVPRLLLHLDIGHANIGFKTNQTPLILRHLSKKLVHVHISDNSGRGDEHLAIGRGNINWPKMLGALKLTGYDGTITLEVFSSRKELMNSAARVRKIWDDL